MIAGRKNEMSETILPTAMPQPAPKKCAAVPMASGRMKPVSTISGTPNSITRLRIVFPAPLHP